MLTRTSDHLITLGIIQKSRYRFIVIMSRLSKLQGMQSDHFNGLDLILFKKDMPSLYQVKDIVLQPLGFAQQH
jgi:hypothetical protein